MLIENYHIREAVVDDVMGVKAGYLSATFSAINTKYGSIDNFLAKEMGLDKRN